MKRDMHNIIKEPDCKLARPLEVGWVVTYEFLCGVARCTGYEPLQN